MLSDVMWTGLTGILVIAFSFAVRKRKRLGLVG